MDPDASTAASPSGSGQRRSGAGTRGRIQLRTLRVRQVIPGGPPEIDATVARWQAVLEPFDAWFAGRVSELRRYECALRDGAWSCIGIRGRAAASIH